MNRRRTSDYARALRAARKAIEASDPIGLLASGSPHNEYDAEMREAARLLVHAVGNGTEDQLARQLGALFSSRFGLTDLADHRLWDEMAEVMLQAYRPESR